MPLSMKRKVIKFLGYTLLLALITLALTIFLPRHYDAPALQKRASTQYWDLPTGSRIGYTMLHAKGKKKSTPVIYLHGGPGGPIWDQNIELLSQLAEDGFDIYLYDQIGGGFSDRLSDIEAYTADRHKRDLAAIVQKIGAEKVILIGQSWGAILATLFAADNPGKIEKIIFTCPGPIEPRKRALAKIAAPDSLQLRVPYFSNAQGNAQANNLRTRTIDFFATTFGVKLASDEEADNFSTYLNSLTNKSLVCDTTKIPKVVGGSGYYSCLMTLNSLQNIPDPRPKLHSAPYPVLVMKGQCDNQKWGFTNEYLEIFPKSQLVIIPNAGHSIGLEQPALYAKTILAFLKRNADF